MAVYLAELARCATSTIAHQLKVCASLRVTPSRGNHVASQTLYVPTRHFYSSCFGGGTKRPDRALTAIGILPDSENIANRNLLAQIICLYANKTQVRTKQTGNRFGASDHSYYQSRPPPSLRQKHWCYKAKNTPSGASGSKGTKKGDGIREKLSSVSTTGFRRDLRILEDPEKQRNTKISGHPDRMLRRFEEPCNCPRYGNSSVNLEVHKIGKNKFDGEIDIKGIGFTKRFLPEEKGINSGAPKSSSNKNKKSKECKENQGFVTAVSGLAKEMGDWLNAVREDLAKIEQAEQMKKYKTMRKAKEKPSGGSSLPHRKGNSKFVSDATVNSMSGKTLNLHEAGTRLSTAGKTSQKSSVKKNFNKQANDSKIFEDIEKLNEDLRRLRRDRNNSQDSRRPPQESPSGKSKDSEDIIEIRPTYVENIVDSTSADLPVKAASVRSTQKQPASRNATQPTSVISTTVANQNHQQEKGFVMSDGTMHSTLVSKNLSGDEDVGLSQQKGFILVDEYLSTAKAAVKAETINEKEEVEHRRSKTEQKNFVLVNDNPHTRAGEAGVQPAKNAKKSTLAAAQDDRMRVAQEDCKFMDDGVYGSAASQLFGSTNEGTAGRYTPLPEADGFESATLSEASSKIIPAPHMKKEELARETELSREKAEERQWARLVQEKLNEMQKKETAIARENKTPSDNSNTAAECYKEFQSCEAQRETQGRHSDGSKGFKGVSTFYAVTPNTIAKDSHEYFDTANRATRSGTQQSFSSITPSGSFEDSEASNGLGPSADSRRKSKAGLDLSPTDTFIKERLFDKLNMSKVPVTELKPEVKPRRDVTQHTVNSAKKSAEPCLFVKPEEVAKKSTAKIEQASAPGRLGAFGSKVSAETKVEPRPSSPNSQLSDIGDQELWSQMLMNKMSEYQKLATLDVKQHSHKTSDKKGQELSNHSPENKGEHKSSKKDYLSDIFSSTSLTAAREAAHKESKSSRDKKLIKELQKQWSKDFKKNIHKTQQEKLLRSKIAKESKKQSVGEKVQRKENIGFTNAPTSPISKPHFKAKPEALNCRSPSPSRVTKPLAAPKVSQTVGNGRSKEDPGSSFQSISDSPVSREGGLEDGKQASSKTPMHRERLSEQRTEIDESQEMDPFEEWIQSRDAILTKGILEETKGKKVQRGKSGTAQLSDRNGQLKGHAKKRDPTRYADLMETREAKSEHHPVTKANTTQLMYKDIRETYLGKALKAESDSVLQHKASKTNDGNSINVSDSTTKRSTRKLSGNEPLTLESVYKNIKEVDAILERLANITPKEQYAKSSNSKIKTLAGLGVQTPLISKNVLDSWDGVATMTLQHVPENSSPCPSKTKKNPTCGSGEGKHVWFQKPLNENSASYNGPEKSCPLSVAGNSKKISKDDVVTKAASGTKNMQDENQPRGSILRKSLADHRHQATLETHKDILELYQERIDKYDAALQRYRERVRRQREEAKRGAKPDTPA